MLPVHDSTESTQFSELKCVVEEVTALRKENLSLKLELERFKSEVISARKLAELDSNRSNILRRILKGVNK